MATATTSTFSLNRDQIIAAALRKIGAYDQQATPEAWQITQAAEALNLVVKSLQAHNIFLWTVETVFETEAAGTSILIPKTDYSDTLDIERIYYKTGATDITIQLVDKFDFADITNKEITGKPLKAWVERKLGQIAIHLWPVLSETLDIYYIRVKRLKDFAAAGNDADFPVHWLEYLINQTAYRLCGEYNIPVNVRQLIKADAQEAFLLARKSNSEPTDLDVVWSAY